MSRMMQTTPSNQDGFASIIIGMILVLVLSLLTVGFAQLVSNDQTQTLNKQLSTQAFYAAESGVNDAIKALPTILASNPTYAGNTNCNSYLPGYNSTDSTIDAANQVSYTCLLVDMTPPTLTYSDVGSQSIAQQFGGRYNGGGAATVGSITVSWQCSVNSSSCNNIAQSSNNLPSSTDWGNQTDALEFNITPLSGANAYQRDQLSANTYTSVLFPRPGAATAVGTATYRASGSRPDVQGQIVGGACNTNSTQGYFCTVTIDVSGAASSDFAFSVRGLYGTDTQVSMSLRDIHDNKIDFSGGQALIDATGKAQNVLKRIQVRIPVGGNADIPSAAIQTAQGVCKRLEAFPGGADFDLTGISAEDAPLCSVAGAAPNGQALITTRPCQINNTCVPNTGPSNGPPNPGKYVWSKNVTNQSPQPPAGVSIIGCQWTVSGGASPASSSGDCQPGNVNAISYPAPANFNTLHKYPSACGGGPGSVQIKVTLTLALSNGQHPSNSTTFRLPECVKA